jgi:hypothetical protein
VIAQLLLLAAALLVPHQDTVGTAAVAPDAGAARVQMGVPLLVSGALMVTYG